MPRSRPVLIALAVTVGLLAAAAVVLYGVARLSWFERQAEQRLSAALGWPVRLGDLAIAYYPSPQLVAENVVVPAALDPGAAPLVEITRVAVTLPWRTLAGLGGHVASLELQAPRVHLATDAVGQANWDGLLGHVATLGGEGPAAFSVGELAVTDGGADYANAADGSRWRLAGINVSASDVRPGTPFDLAVRVAGEGAGHTFHAAAASRALLDPDREVYAVDEATLEGWIGGGELPLAGVEWDSTVEALHADLAAGRTTLRGLRARTMGAELAAAGELETNSEQIALSFTVQTGPFSPRAVAVALGQPLPETSDPAALTHAKLEVAGGWRGGELTLYRLEGEFDGSRFSGDAMLPGDGAPPRLRLAVDRLDLDPYLPPDAAETGADDSLASVVEGLRQTLQRLDLDAEVTIGAARGAGVRARDLTIRLTPLATEGGG